MLVDTIEKVKNVSVGYVGSNGLFDSATVNAYTASLRGLSATQAEVVLSSAGLDIAQRKQIITALEAVTATKTLTAEEALSAMTRKAGSAEAAKELLIKSKLVTADQLEAGAEIQVSTEKLKSAVASGFLSQSEADNIAVALGLTGANIGLETSFKLLATSIWASVKAMVSFLLTNPVGWAILATTAIAGLVKGYDTLIGRQEKLSRQKIEGLDEDISRLDEEIKSLEELQSKLEDAKGSRYELSQIQSELNDVIGETPGLLNGESKAWDIANAKLKANLELKKQQREQAQKDKVEESKVLYDNNAIEIDWHSDKSGKDAREYAKALALMKTYTDGKDDWESYLKFVESEDYKNLSQEQKAAIADAMTFKTTYDTEWAEYLKEQAETALSVFDDTISNYDGVGGQEFIKGLISDMARDGASLSEISDVVRQVINNKDMQDAINKYWESLVNPDIDSEQALQAVKKIFDDIIAKNPALKDFFDNFYNGIVSGGKAAAETSSDVDEMTDSLEHLEKARDFAQKVSDIQEDLAEKEKDFAENMADAWKEEHLAQLKDGLEKQKDLIDRYKKNVEILDFGLDHVETDDFANRTDLLSEKLDKLKSYGAAMRAEFDRVATTIPQTGDEAVELANRLEELGSDMRDNVTAIRETVVALQMLNIDMASTLIDDRMSELQSELDNIDKRINILNSGYKNDYQYASSVLSMDMLLPTYSEYDKKRREKQRADRALIDTEQETQDKINEIVTESLEKQAQQNAEARAKERQKLIEDMEKARQEAQKKLAEAGQDYLDFLKENGIATAESVKEIEDMFADADIKLPEIDITSVDDAMKKIKEKLGGMFSLDGSGVVKSGNKMIDEASKYVGQNNAGGRFSDGRIEAWCADFVSYVAKQVGVDTIPQTASVWNMYDYFKKNGGLSQTPAVGAIVMFDWGNGGNVYDHVGIVTGFDDKYIYTIEGNTTNTPGGQVARMTRPRYSNILGYGLYADGTKYGNRLASTLGIAGENYKPEILIDKATGKATYIDSPTVIDPSKTDVVGEKQTARLPKFAEGTEKDDPFSIDKIGKFYDDAVDSISRIESKIIEQVQSALNDDTLDDLAKSERLYGSKYDAGLEASAIGKTIYDNLESSYREWLKAIDDGTAKWSLEVYNAYKDAFAGISDLTYEMANSAVESKQASADLRFENSNNWISDRNFFNDWELFDDSEVEAWERVVKWLKSEYPNEIEKIKQAEQNLFTARKNASEKAISDIEEYISARNHYNDWDAYGDSEVKAIQRQTKIIEEEYRKRLISYEEYVDRMEESSQRIYSLGQSRVDKHLSNIDNYISARNHYGDWDEFNDNEIKAIQRQCAVLDEAYKLNLISLEEYTEKSAEYTQKLYSAARDNITKTISELVEDYGDTKRLESSQYGSLKTLLQSYYDVTNAVSEAQHEINNELKTSMTMYEYLNEETRNMLFNQDDYDVLNEKLLDIQSAANELQEQYNNDILNANAETIDEITSKYQMQYDIMMKQYEVAKAELDVAKKRQKLDNVLAERNTRMFVNGQWQWVANTQNVIDAQNELAEAESGKKKQETSFAQTESINKFTEQIDSIETDLNQVEKKWSDMQEMLEGESSDIVKVLKEISEVSSPELQRVIEATCGSIDSFSASLSKSIDAMSVIINGNSNNSYTNVSSIVADLKTYSDAIKDVNDRASVSNTSVNQQSNSDAYIQSTIAKMKANSEKWYSAGTQEERDRLYYLNQGLGKSIGAKYNESTGEWYTSDGERLLYHVSSATKSSLSNASTTTGGSYYVGSSSDGKLISAPSSGRVVQAGSDGNAPAGAKVGDVVETAGGDYLIVPAGTEGANQNPANGLWSIKIEKKYATGTRHTNGGMTLMGESGFEAFIDNNGRLIPIDRPALGNIGSGGIVFNQEQMSNLRNLWDLSNMCKVTPFASSSSINKQNSFVDNSIHINGLTVGEQGNEDWINGLRRYVATHK